MLDAVSEFEQSLMEAILAYLLLFHQNSRLAHLVLQANVLINALIQTNY